MKKCKRGHSPEVFLGQKAKKSYWGCITCGAIQYAIDHDWYMAESQDLGAILKKCYGKDYGRRLMILLYDSGHMKHVLRGFQKDCEVMLKKVNLEHEYGCGI